MLVFVLRRVPCVLGLYGRDDEAWSYRPETTPALAPSLSGSKRRHLLGGKVKLVSAGIQPWNTNEDYVWHNP